MSTAAAALDASYSDVSSSSSEDESETKISYIRPSEILEINTICCIQRFEERELEYGLVWNVILNDNVIGIKLPTFYQTNFRDLDHFKRGKHLLAIWMAKWKKYSDDEQRRLVEYVRI